MNYNQFDVFDWVMYLATHVCLQTFCNRIMISVRTFYGGKIHKVLASEGEQ